MFKNLRASILFVLTMFSSAVTFAVPFAVDVNGIYFSDTLSPNGATEDTVVTRMAMDASIGLSLVHDEWLFIGASLFSANTMEKETTEVSWKTSDVGLRLIWFFDRVKQWGLGVAYHLSAKGSFNDGTNTEYWRGSSYKIDFGYTPLLFHKFYFGLRMNYYVAQYDESSSDNSTFVSEKNTRTFIYPSIYLGMRFQLVI